VQFSKYAIYFYLCAVFDISIKIINKYQYISVHFFKLLKKNILKYLKGSNHLILIGQVGGASGHGFFRKLFRMFPSMRVFKIHFSSFFNPDIFRCLFMDKLRSNRNEKGLKIPKG